MGLSAFGTLMLMWWMHVQQKLLAFKWYGMAVLPLAILAWAVWKVMKRSIRRDMNAARNGLPLKNGIPHHGMMIMLSTKFLLAVGVWVCQVVVTIMLNNENGAIVFGIANAVTNFLLIGVLYIICRIERGYSTAIDEKP